MKEYLITEEEKERLERHMNQVQKMNSENLLQQYTEVIRMQEYNRTKKGTENEYYSALIDKLWEEIVKRMKH